MSMLIMGYRGTVEWSKVRAAIKRCTEMTAPEIEKIVKNVKDGKAQTIPNDHILYEDLRELGLLIK
jgi:hypothetical protein